MLNGLAPLFVYHMHEAPKTAQNLVAGIPEVGDFLLKNIGVPIPLYLDEQLTGIYVTNESTSIEIKTDFEGTKSGKPPTKLERPLGNTVSVEMLGRRDSLVLAVLIALSDVAFQRAVAGKYGLTYLNGPTAVFGGTLASFAANTNRNDTLVRVTLQISKPASTPQLADIPIAQKVSGPAVPAP